MLPNLEREREMVREGEGDRERGRGRWRERERVEGKRLDTRTCTHARAHTHTRTHTHHMQDAWFFSDELPALAGLGTSVLAQSRADGRGMEEAGEGWKIDNDVWARAVATVFR